MAVPVNPIRVKDKITGAKRYFEFHDDAYILRLDSSGNVRMGTVILEN